jgi:arylsulfatase A-like enzyme
LQTSTVANRTQGNGSLTIASANSPAKSTSLRPGLAFLSVAALICLSLEVEVLQQIDGLRLYLTLHEISLDVGFALLVTLAMACAWWLVVLLLGRLARMVIRNKQLWIKLQWALWISVPLVYLTFDVLRDFNLLLLPDWRPSPNSEVFSSALLLGVCVTSFLRITWPAPQEFCRTRLAPIGWLHIVLATMAVISLFVHGVRPFRDYENPARAAAISNFPDIYLITIDALKAEDTSVYGYSRPTTPNLEKLAQRSFIFDNFFANANFTNPSTSSIETGKLPWSHRVLQQGTFLRGKNQQENLAAELRQRGYYTGMISSNFFGAPFRHRTSGSYDAVGYAFPRGLTGIRLRVFNWIGLDTQATLSLSLIRGPNSLSSYLDRFFHPEAYPSPAEPVFTRATELVERVGGAQPVFLWTHIYPPHDPYLVPPAYRHRFVPATARNYRYMSAEKQKQGPGVTVEELHAAYDEMILYADHSVGEFIDWLQQTGRFDRSIVIVSADHGELFDHGRLSHGGPDLYNGLIHVPLLVHLPGQTHAEHIAQLSQQADLLPTLLDLVSSPVPSWTDGSSLKSTLQGNNLPPRYIFSMNLEMNSIFDPITKGTIAVMDDNFKFVRYFDLGKEQLFRYNTDPGELNNLINSEPEVAKRMRGVLQNKLQEVNQKPVNLQ